MYTIILIAVSMVIFFVACIGVCLCIISKRSDNAIKKILEQKEKERKMINGSILFVLLIACVCFPQTKMNVAKDIDSVTICWNRPENIQEGGKFLIYYHLHADGNWIYIAQTYDDTIKVKRPFVGGIVFGVRYVINNDTAEMHSSLDSTACRDNKCGEECSEYGPWYAYFELDKPYGIRIK